MVLNRGPKLSDPNHPILHPHEQSSLPHANISEANGVPVAEACQPPGSSGEEAPGLSEQEGPAQCLSPIFIAFVSGTDGGRCLFFLPVFQRALVQEITL